jgi:hypothetical protein
LEVRRPRIERGHGPAAVPAYVLLITRQHADGSWDLDEQFATAIKRNLHDLAAALGAEAGNAEARRVWATALAIAWLNLHGSSSREQWALVEMKAREWLHHMMTAMPEGGPWITKAEEYLRATR